MSDRITDPDPGNDMALHLNSRVIAMLPHRWQGASKEQGARVLEAINGSGRTFLIHTELGGKFTMRLAIGGTQTQASTD